jgi:uncharacterized protein
MTVTLHRAASIHDVKAADWDRLANPLGQAFNPFLSYAFLSSLEDSNSVGKSSGWLPSHMLLRQGQELAGTVPAYLKSHSQGEYVFDYGWADAFQRAGGRYYPKLQVSIPFTPATGPRILAPSEELRSSLISGLEQQCKDLGASSVHITFVPENQAAEIAQAGWLTRNDIQFHWNNQGYSSFEDFLVSLSSAKRKNLRKERKVVAAAGIEFEWATGANLREDHWDHFFAFYMDTGSRKWGRPYLTRQFFSLIHERMPEHTLLVLARRNGKYIAGALNFIGSDTLYGRNWGCVEDHPCLHFETCYYQAIDFAISRKLKVVEAGAQGEHKLARGYLPAKTYSLHFVAHPGLRRAVADYLVAERQAIEHDKELLAEHSPFRHSE